MGREKDRKLRRRKRRQAKLHVLKNKLGQTKDPKDKQNQLLPDDGWSKIIAKTTARKALYQDDDKLTLSGDKMIGSRYG